MFDFPIYFYDTDRPKEPLSRREERALLVVSLAIGLCAAAFLLVVGF